MQTYQKSSTASSAIFHQADNLPADPREEETTISSSRPFPAPEKAAGRLAGCAGERTAAVAGVPLGTTGKLVHPPLDVVAHRMRRWALQAAAKDILKGHPVCYCMRHVKPNKEHVQVFHSPKHDSYHYGNLMTCRNVWVCPICNRKITEKRRVELVQGVSNWRAKGGGVLLLTLTAPHYAHQRLRPVLDGISHARKLMLHRKPWKKMKNTLGIVGDVCALEVTHGGNGWHPHFHVLVFTKIAFTHSSLPSIELMILEQWKKACLTAGLPEPNRHGVSVEDGSKAAAYASKWGLEHEMTKGHIKKGREGGKTVSDMLQDYLETKSPESARLFREFAEAFKGKKQLHWSSGLRDLVGLNEESTDEELADKQEEDAALFAEIPLALWRVVLVGDRRGHLLEKCREGEVKLWSWLMDIAEDAGIVSDGGTCRFCT